MTDTQPMTAEEAREWAAEIQTHIDRFPNPADVPPRFCRQVRTLYAYADDLDARMKTIPDDAREELRDMLRNWANAFFSSDPELSATQELIEDRIAALFTPQWRGADIQPILEALKPFAGCVFNDNGDITVSMGDVRSEHCEDAYWALKNFKPLPDSADNVQELHKTPEDGVGNTDTTPPADQREAVAAEVKKAFLIDRRGPTNANKWLELDRITDRILSAVRGKAKPLDGIEDPVNAIAFAAQMDDAFEVQQFLTDWQHGELSHWQAAYAEAGE